MARAYYRTTVSTWDAEDAVGRPNDCIEAGRGSTYVYLLSPIDPHLALEAFGATRLGNRPDQLSAAAKSAVIGDDGISPAVIFAGDEIADYLPPAA